MNVNDTASKMLMRKARRIRHNAKYRDGFLPALMCFDTAMLMGIAAGEGTVWPQYDASFYAPSFWFFLLVYCGFLLWFFVERARHR